MMIHIAACRALQAGEDVRDATHSTRAPLDRTSPILRRRCRQTAATISCMVACATKHHQQTRHTPPQPDLCMPTSREMQPPHTAMLPRTVKTISWKMNPCVTPSLRFSLANSRSGSGLTQRMHQRENRPNTQIQIYRRFVKVEEPWPLSHAAQGNPTAIPKQQTPCCSCHCLNQNGD
jgi:hypothetical protein